MLTAERRSGNRKTQQKIKTLLSFLVGEKGGGGGEGEAWFDASRCNADISGWFGNMFERGEKSRDGEESHCRAPRFHVRSIANRDYCWCET